MQYYKLAKVLKPQGLKGELKLKPFVDDLSRFYDLSHIYLNQNGVYQKYPVEHARTYKQFAFVKIKGVERFEEADLLRGAFLYIDKAHAVKPEGSHFIADLIGMQVQDRQGKRYGTLNDVLQTGATDIYVVAGDCNFLFPAAKHVVLDIDETARVILIDETRLREVAVYD